MGNAINKTYFNCIENDNDNNSINIYNKCDTYIGFHSKKGLYAFRILSIISFILNLLFLIFQFLKIKKSKKTKKNVMRTFYKMPYNIFFNWIIGKGDF